MKTDMTAAELRAIGFDVSTDEEWQRSVDARQAEHLELQRDLEEQAIAAAEVHAAETAKWKTLAGDPDAFVAAFNEFLVEEPESPTAKSKAAVETTSAPVRDWVDEAIDSVPPGPSSLPYRAYRAHRELHETQVLMRQMAGRNISVSWSIDPQSADSDPEKRSRISIDNCSLNKEANRTINKEERTSRLSLASFVSRGRHQVVDIPEWTVGSLPTWKYLGSQAASVPELRELQFGLRVASLAADTDLTNSAWLKDVPGNDVGFLSIELHGDAANRFQWGENGSAATGLRRGLLRALKSYTDGLETVAVWTANEANPDSINLFLAMRMVDARSINRAITLDAGERYIRSLEAHGVSIDNGRANETELPAYYGVTDEQLAECDPEDPLAPSWTDFVAVPEGGDLDEFTPGVGFASVEEIEQRRLHAETRWLGLVHAHGLPSWFTSDLMKHVQDGLLRDPESAKALAQIVARMKKKKATPADLLAIKKLDCTELTLPKLQFYRASPAQFAAIAVRSGLVLGDYCDSRHKAGRAKNFYEQLLKVD